MKSFESGTPFNMKPCEPYLCLTDDSIIRMLFTHWAMESSCSSLFHIDCLYIKLTSEPLLLFHTTGMIWHTCLLSRENDTMSHFVLFTLHFKRMEVFIYFFSPAITCIYSMDECYSKIHAKASACSGCSCSCDKYQICAPDDMCHQLYGRALNKAANSRNANEQCWLVMCIF